MPISSTATISHVLVDWTVNIQSAVGQAVFATLVDGVQTGTKTMRVEGLELQGLLGAMPTLGKTRADDITDAVYEHAVNTGFIVGEIT